MIKINCKGKRTVGKANERINVEKIVIDLKIKIENWKKENKKGYFTELQKLNVEAEIYSNNKSVTEYTHIHP